MRVFALLLSLGLAACVTEGETLRPPEPLAAAKLYTELGFGYLRQDRFDLAQEKFAKALELDPGRGLAMFGEGMVYYRQGKTIEGRAAVDRAARKVGTDLALRNAIADWYCEVGAVDAARSLLDGALRQFESDAVLRMGRCLRGNGFAAQADTLWREALAATPDSGQLLIGLAAYDVRQRDWARARMHLDRYARIAPPTEQSAWLGLQVAIAFEDEPARQRHARVLERLSPDIGRRFDLKTGKPRNANDA